MGRWRGDKRENKRRLSLVEAVGDAYLVVVENCEKTVICDLPKGNRDLPTPRLVGYVERGVAIAWIPGSFMATLMQKKNGFSEAEQYLTRMVEMFGSDLDSLKIVIWDPEEETAVDRIGKLGARLDVPVERLGADAIAEAVDRLVRYARGTGTTRENWVLDSWRWLEGKLMRGEATTERQT